MAKVSITTIENLQNEASVVEKINGNFTAIQAAVEKTLFRDGTSPNQMVSDFDANNHRILNLPTPTDYNEPALHGELQQYVDAAEDAQVAAETAQGLAETAQEAAETAQENAETAETGAENTLAEFQTIWLGVKTADPTGTITEGAFYFNSTNNSLRVYSNGAFVQGYVVPDDYVSEAPNDAGQYVRQSEAWVALDLTAFVESVDVEELVVTDQTTYDGLTPDASTLYFILAS